MMSKESEYLAFAFEMYRGSKNMKGKEAFKLLYSCGALEYVRDLYEMLHQQSSANMVDAVDEYLSARGIEPPKTVCDLGK